MLVRAPDAVLIARIARLRGRIRLLLAQRWAVRGLIAATLLAAVAALLMRRAGTPLPAEWLLPAFLAALAAGALWGGTRAVSSMDAARLADQRLGLKERLSSGLEFATRLSGSNNASEGEAFLRAQIADAARHGERLRPAELFPWRLPGETRWLAATALLLAGVMILPELALLQSPRERAERAALKREGERLETIAREVGRRKELTNAEVSRQVAENLRQLGVQMQRGRVDKKRAMLDASRLTKELQEARRQAAGPPPGRSLSQATADLKAAASALPPRSEGERAAANVAASLDERDLDAAGEALRSLAETLKRDSLSPEEAESVRDALARMAKALEGTDLDAAATPLREAAKELDAARKLAGAAPGEKGETERQQRMARASEACAEAGGTCRSTGERLRSMDALAQLADALAMASSALAAAGEEGERLADTGPNGDAKGGDAAAGQAAQGAGGRAAGVGDRGDAPGVGAGVPVPKSLGASGMSRTDRLVPGRPRPGTEVVRPFQGSAGRAETRAAYSEVYPSARRAAEEALSREQVPAGYRRPVRAYFESIAPQ